MLVILFVVVLVKANLVRSEYMILSLQKQLLYQVSNIGSLLT